MTELPITRQSLLLRLKRRSDDAWTEFIRVYENAIVRFGCSKGLQDADALDVAQEVFSALHNRLETWDVDADRGSLRGWLFRVARNIVVDKIRERSRLCAACDVEAASATLAQPDAEASAFLFELRHSLFQWAAAEVRDEVKESTWQCFWETAVENNRPDTVAQHLKVSVGTVYTAKCRVVARIRSKIAELEDADGLSFDDLPTKSLSQNPSPLPLSPPKGEGGKGYGIGPKAPMTGEAAHDS